MIALQRHHHQVADYAAASDSSAMGKMKEKQLPRPSPADSARMLPRWCSTILWHNARLMPMSSQSNLANLDWLLRALGLISCGAIVLQLLAKARWRCSGTDHGCTLDFDLREAVLWKVGIESLQNFRLVPRANSLAFLSVDGAW